jgi:hypothetical protein
VQYFFYTAVTPAILFEYVVDLTLFFDWSESEET